MHVNEMAMFIKEFDAGLAWRDFNYDFSPPWHLKQWRECRVPFENEPCVYIITKPAEPNWDIPLADNEADIWYIGKSGRGASRVWEHLGNLPGLGAPRFANHRWATTHSIPPQIRDAIAEAKSVLYTIKIVPGGKKALPIALEKFILARFYQKYGEFPPLNLEA